ncbi:MAG: hypothetical protein WDZ49_01665 [Litorilinea sp.]
MAHNDAVEFADLVEWAEGRVDATRAATIAEAVAQDADLQTQVAWIREFLQVAQTVTLVDPPPALQAQLRAQFRLHRAATQARTLPAQPLGAGLGAWVERLVAALTLDSRAQALPAGARGGGAGHRQLAYSTPQGDIAFSILGDAHAAQATSARLTVHGQIFPLENGIEGSIAPHAVQFAVNDTEAAWVESDELGEFIVEGLAPGQYDVVVSGAAYEWVLPAVPIYLDAGLDTAAE